MYFRHEDKVVEIVFNFLLMISTVIGVIWWWSFIFKGEVMLFLVFPFIYAILSIPVLIFLTYAIYLIAAFIYLIINRLRKNSARKVIIQNPGSLDYLNKYKDLVQKIDSSHFKVNIASEDSNKPDWVTLEIAQNYDPGKHIERVSRQIKPDIYDVIKNITQKAKYDINFNSDWEESVRVRFYGNGQKKCEFSLNGAPEDKNFNGNYRDWFPNGIQKSEGKYKDGKKDGLWKYWWYDGSLGTEIEYKNGLPNGNEKSNEHGVKSIAKWEDGVWLGLFCKEMDEDNKLQNQRYAKANEIYKKAKRIGYIDTL